MKDEPIDIFDFLGDEYKDKDLIDFLMLMEAQAKRKLRMSSKQCEKLRQLLKERDQKC